MNLRRGVFGILRDSFRGYGRYLIILTLAAVMGAVLDGIGINAVIPLLSFLSGGAEVIPNDFITNAIRSFFGVIGIPFTFRFLLAFIVILFLLRAVLVALFAYIRARVTAGYMFKEATALLQKTLAARWSFLITQKTGYLQNTLYWDVKRSSQLLDGVVQFIQSSTGFVIYLVVAVNISPVVTLITLTSGGLLLLLLHPLVRTSIRLGEETSNTEKNFVHHLSEHIGGFKTIKASGAETSVTKKGASLLEILRHIYTKTALIQMSGNALIQPFSFIFIIILFAIAYRLPGFNLAAFAATLYLVQKIFTYLQSWQASLHAIADQVPFAANINKYKKQIEPEIPLESSGTRKFLFEHELKFNNVSFSYTNDITALHSVTFVIPKGSVTGIVGPSGAGKTSIADLMLRLFMPKHGNVLLDGIPVEQIQIQEWRKNIAYVAQDIFLVNTSIKENIRFYDESVSDEVIEKAAKQAHIYEDITKLPEGFETIVGDRGVMLSGGQRQRIALARALARKPQLLVLDEATSALDSESEQAIQKAIEEIRGRVTIIIIAHRLATVMAADQLIVLEKGQIIETGATTSADAFEPPF